METTTSPSEKILYLDVFTFSGKLVKGHSMHEYGENEALQMYQRGVNKYKASGEPILISLRDQEHQLLKSELLNYKAKGDMKK